MGDYESLARFALDHGFGLIQISLDNPRYFPELFDARRRSEIACKFKELSIGLCFHGPSDISLMNRHEKIRTAGLERLYEMIDMSVDMGADYFVFHPGRLALYSNTTQKVFFMEQRFPDRFRELFTDSLMRLVAHSGKKVRLCLEITHAIASPFLGVISHVADEKGLALVWDVGHTELLTGGKRQQALRFFQDNLANVKLAHLHDISDGVDHKALGTGRIDIASYLEIFNTMGIDIILEVFPEEDLLKSLDYLKNLELAAKRGLPG